MKQLVNYLSFLFIAIALTACGGDDDGPEPSAPSQPKTISDITSSAPNLKTLTTALKATGLDVTLDDASKQFTVFAPTDEAFALLGDQVAALLNDTAKLEDILKYHVLDGKVSSTAAFALDGTTTAALNGDNLGISKNGEGLYINLSLVVTADIAADNGVIHLVNAVLMPPADKGTPDKNIVETAQADTNFSMLVDLLGKADLVDALSDESATFTVFAPTNKAFEILGAENLTFLNDVENRDLFVNLLKQHVVPSEINSTTLYTRSRKEETTLSDAKLGIKIVKGKLFFGNSEIVTKDIYTSNGVIHAIDTVIRGEFALFRSDKTVKGIAAGADNFKILVELADRAMTTVPDGEDKTKDIKITEWLDDTTKAFTLFAPTDTAFQKLGVAQLAKLRSADPKDLGDWLKYHILDSRVLAEDAMMLIKDDKPLATTTNEAGDKVSLTLNEDLFVNFSKVTSPNTVALNGVIHTVDTVLMVPPVLEDSPENIIDIVNNDDQFNILMTALKAADLVDALQDETKKITVFAPTDTAFKTLPQGVLDAMLNDGAKLDAVLKQHVLATEVDATAAAKLNGTMIDTLGAQVAVSIQDGTIVINDSKVIVKNIKAKNGIIHVVDTVVTGAVDLPKPTLVDVATGRGNFTVLLDLLTQAELVDLLTDFSKEFTVFAPNDAAFAMLDQAVLDGLKADKDALTDVLTYHVLASKVFAAEATWIAGTDKNIVEAANMDKLALSLSGSNLFVNTSKVVLTNQVAENGALHEVDTVLIPPKEMGMPDKTILELVQEGEQFTKLESAVVAAELTEILADEKQFFTVFAPNDAAFEKVEKLDDLLKPEQKNALLAILQQHVIVSDKSAVPSVWAYALNGKKVLTAGGKEVKIEVGSGYLKVQGAKVLMTDIYAKNGIIHVIDTVIVDATDPI